MSRLTLFSASAEPTTPAGLSRESWALSPTQTQIEGCQALALATETGRTAPPSQLGMARLGAFPLSPLPNPPSILSPAAKTLSSTPCTWLPLASSLRPLMEDKPPPAQSSCQPMPELAGSVWFPLAAPPGLVCQQLHARLTALYSPWSFYF